MNKKWWHLKCIKPEKSFKAMPPQGVMLGLEVELEFIYNSGEFYSGICVRHDAFQPFVTIFKVPELNNFVLANECHYKIKKLGVY